MSDATKKAGEEQTTAQKSGNEPSTQDAKQEEKITLSQEELNALINKKYAKGAEKAKNELLGELGVKDADELKQIIEAKKQQEEASKSELEKIQEQLEAERIAKADLEKDLNATKKQASLSAMAAKHGIKELEYFDVVLSKEQNKEDFDEAAFIEKLKTEKPFIFGVAPKVDNSPNTTDEPKSLKDKLGTMSFEELKKLQKTL